MTDDKRTALEVLRSMLGNDHLALGDLVYNVRDAEGKGWNGPSVKQWSDDVSRAQALVNDADKREATTLFNDAETRALK